MLATKEFITATHTILPLQGEEATAFRRRLPNDAISWKGHDNSLAFKFSHASVCFCFFFFFSKLHTQHGTALRAQIQGPEIKT